MRIRIGHSGDSAEGFLFDGLSSGGDPGGEHDIELVTRPIGELDAGAFDGELEATVLSVPAWLAARSRYQPLRCGGRYGLDCGPVIVSERMLNALELPYRIVAVPGERTTGLVLLHLIAREPPHAILPAEAILPAVEQAQVDAGMLDDEAQVAYEDWEFEPVLDLGRWWYARTHLPLPLRLLAVRRDLGPAVVAELAWRVEASIRHGLEHREAVLERLMDERIELEREYVEAFIDRYVTKFALDPGQAGTAGLRMLLKLGVEAGLMPEAPEVDFV